MRTDCRNFSLIMRAGAFGRPFTMEPIVPCTLTFQV